MKHLRQEADKKNDCLEKRETLPMETKKIPVRQYFFSATLVSKKYMCTKQVMSTCKNSV